MVLFAVCICLPAIAQKSKKEMKKEFMTTMSEMTPDQQKKLLNYARNLETVDTKKVLTKTFKKLSAEDKAKLLDYGSKLNTPVVKAPVTKPKVNMKDGVANKPKMNPKKAAAPVGNLTKVEVLDKTYDFGTITQGEKAQTIYKIKNVGQHPLIISKAKGSCGCTVPKWPKGPIAPGEIAEIDVVFNSRGKKGKQSKRITITANTDPGQTFLTIKGEVKMPDPNAPKKAPVKQ